MSGRILGLFKASSTASFPEPQMARCLRLMRVLPLLLLAACGVHRTEYAGAPKSDPNLLTTVELTNYNNAFLAVQTLRPAWLRTRAAGSRQQQGKVWVYRDGMRFGGVDRLSSMDTLKSNRPTITTGSPRPSAGGWATRMV